MTELVNLQLPDKFQALFFPGFRYRVFFGGRGGAKTESFARVLIAKAYTEKLLILCTRQYQVSITNSVHKTLIEMIYELGLQAHFDIQRTTIICRRTGSQFIFKGLHNNISEIKSMHGVNIVWIEEGDSCSMDSWLHLDPTIRADDSEIWISFNPNDSKDFLYSMFVVNTPPPNAVVTKVNWRDNPWFNKSLEIQRQYMLKNDPDSYDWMWEGDCRSQTEASVFRNKLLIEPFEEPEDRVQFYHGLDFGFADDPSCLIRCWINPNYQRTGEKDGKTFVESFGECLMIDREAYGHHIEIDEMPAFMDNACETARFWHIKADNARPETISYLSRQGYGISAAEKWKGSVEDGIAHLRGFKKIVIHPRLCPNTARDFRLYRYKVDKNAVDEQGRPLVLPILEDKMDHAPDACRYALDGMIQHRGGLGMWKRLLGKG